MEKINIAELLKDCPSGMELDCTMFDNVTFVRVDNSRERFPIEIVVSGLYTRYLTKEGCYNDNTFLPDAKCVIFPKGKTTWEGFVPPCKFKVGDRIRWKADPKFVFTITSITKDKYECGKTFVLRFTNQDEYELVPNKFDITTLKPFESKVLVRDRNTDKWIGAFYSHCKSNGKKFYTIGSSYYYQCIPYEGNEHLLDTTDDCDEYFKIWE